MSRVGKVEMLYEDKFLVVCVKPIGVLSAPEAGKRQNMPDLLKRQTRAYRVDIIHRLDQPVGGVMVYSKSSKATPSLYRQMAGHEMVKEYLAVVCGVPEQPCGRLEDWLLKDSAHCKSRVVPPRTRGAKEAALSYRTLATAVRDGTTLSLVKVRLHTGRTHQIRVQFSSRGLPLLGDEKYGGIAADGFRGLGLWSYHLAFRHPTEKKAVDVCCAPPRTFPWTLFREADIAQPIEQ